MSHGSRPPSISLWSSAISPFSTGLLAPRVEESSAQLFHILNMSWLGKPSPVSLGNFFSLPCLGVLLSNWAMAVAGERCLHNSGVSHLAWKKPLSAPGRPSPAYEGQAGTEPGSTLLLPSVVCESKVHMCGSIYLFVPLPSSGST